MVTDSNRRRRVVPEFLHQNVGATLAADERPRQELRHDRPFATRGSDAQTVQQLQGARYLRAPSSGGLLEFPEYGAIAAFDGDPDTVWAADRYLHPRERWIEIGFDRPRDVPYVDLLPVRDWSGMVTEVDVGGVRAKVGPGRTRVRVGLHDVPSLRITITKVGSRRGTCAAAAASARSGSPASTCASRSGRRCSPGARAARADLERPAHLAVRAQHGRLAVPPRPA